MLSVPLNVTAPPASAQARITSFIASAEFPCVGAKSALNKDRMRFGRYQSLADGASAAALCSDLALFSAEFPDPGNVPVSFIATFANAEVDELQFESLIWKHLQLMHDRDRQSFAWDPSVSADPDHEDFSFSLARRAYFVVGLHPRASRLARKAPMPCLVFNFHNQFESLKQTGKFASMQTAIRERDTALQGFLNPVLARFGDASEARQYSGRAVKDEWRCPFRSGSPAYV